MALEKDFELLDDYLANRLSGEEKVEFENKLQSDPELKSEYQFQKGLIDNIRQARAAELKAMLNNIPVAAIPTTQSAIIGKIVGAVIVTALITSAVLLLMDKDDGVPVQTETEQKSVEAIIEPGADETEQQDESSETSDASKSTSSKIEPTEERKPSTVNKPKLDVYDPTKEESEQLAKEREQIEFISKAFVTSSIEVVIDKSNKKLTFHYNFENGKLVLYGGFEKHVYEILEFIGENKKTVFLYYRTNYYMIDLDKTTPTLLVPIKDPQLIKKLRSFRSK